MAVHWAVGDGPYITHVTCGRIVDWGITDANNMGAAMAPAAYDTLRAHFTATATGPEDYDLIVTGGSDFHGANHGKPHPVGACVTEDDQIARIEALARKRRGGAL